MWRPTLWLLQAQTQIETQVPIQHSIQQHPLIRGAWQHWPTAVGIVLVIVVGAVAHRLIQHALHTLAKKEYLPASLMVVLQGLARWVVIVLVLVLVLQQMGIPVTHVWTALSAFVVMVAIGFVAVWSILSNILCSVLLIVFAPFRIGDDIEIIEATGGQGLRGHVVGINVLFTSIREPGDDPAGHRVANVPNNVFFQKTIRVTHPHETQ